MFNNPNNYSLSDIATATRSNNDGFGFDGNGAWILLLFIILLMGGWNNNNFGGNGGGTAYVANDVQRGFDQAALTSGMNDLSTGMTNGFANVQQSLCNGFAQAQISNNARQMADMNQNFAMQTVLTQNLNTLQSQLAQCCCDNKSATNDLRYLIATENCADRAALSDALKDVLIANTANTQLILDKLCQQENEALKAENQRLQMQNYLSSLAASQNAQTGQILTDNAAQTAALIQAINPAPIPAYIVNNSTGCGCNGNAFYN